MYQHPFQITTRVSNNAFSYDRRVKPLLHVPLLQKGTVADVKIGQEIVFEDFDDDGKLHSCYGLEHFVQTHIKDIPSVIFDNHNHAFYFWQEAKQKGFIRDGALLVHIDQHKDNRQPESFLTPQQAQDLNQVFTYTNTVLNVGNFIPAAQKTGLVGDVIFINSEASLLDFQTELKNGKFDLQNVILDIDLDFFAPEFDYIDDQLKANMLREILPHAKFITVATSPFFIDQKLALEWLQRINDLFPINNL